MLRTCTRPSAWCRAGSSRAGGALPPFRDPRPGTEECSSREMLGFPRLGTQPALALPHHPGSMLGDMLSSLGTFLKEPHDKAPARDRRDRVVRTGNRL